MSNTSLVREGKGERKRGSSESGCVTANRTQLCHSFCHGQHQPVLVPISSLGQIQGTDPDNFFGGGGV